LIFYYVGLNHRPIVQSDQILFIIKFHIMRIPESSQQSIIVLAVTTCSGNLFHILVMRIRKEYFLKL